MTTARTWRGRWPGSSPTSDPVRPRARVVMFGPTEASARAGCTCSRDPTIIGTETVSEPDGASHDRPPPPAIVVEPQRPVRATARRPDLEADGGARRHDLGGRHRLLRALRHRPLAGPLPGRDGPASA